MDPPELIQEATVKIGETHRLDTHKGLRPGLNAAEFGGARASWKRRSLRLPNGSFSKCRPVLISICCRFISVSRPVWDFGASILFLSHSPT